MNVVYIITQLEKNIAVFLELLNDVNEDVAKWKVNPEKWNLLEIVCHLYMIHQLTSWIMQGIGKKIFSFEFGNERFDQPFLLLNIF